MADYEDLVPSKLERLKLFAPVILRIALGLVFLWFGTNQIMNSSGWTSFLPDFILQIPIPPVFIIFLNGVFEVVLGIFLIIGVFIRASAFLLGAHLLGITLSLGISSVGVRDFGLSFAVLAVAAFGNDILSLDGFLEKHKTLRKSLFASIFYYVVLLVIAGSTSVYAFNVFHKSDSYKEINLPAKEAPIISEDALINKPNSANTTTKPAINSGLTLTKEVVAKHNVSKDCWIIIEAKIYNVTQYIPFHPGGEKQIISRCGTDASNAFKTKGGLGESHSSNAKKLLEQYYVGAVGQKLVDNTLVKPTASTPKPNTPSTSNNSPSPNTVPANTNTVNTPSKITTPVSAPQNSPASSGMTASSVATHNSSQDCWIIVSGKVYNVTQYIPFHPGGQAQIISRCGTDATTAFNTKGGSGNTHSTNAHNLLANYYVGDVGLASSPTPTTTPTTPAQNTSADTTAPVVSISTPTQGATLSGTATISASASDSNGILNVKFMIDGTTFQTISSAPFSVVFVTTNYGNGNHTISVSAVDLAGNTGSASINISINNQATQTGPTTYAAADVATHGSQSSCWIIVSGKVYNVTQYIPFHPGGANRIINVCGTDATVAFNTRGGSGSHSQNAHNLLAGYYLGDLGSTTSSGTTTPSSSPTSSPTGTNGTYTVTVSSNGALNPASLTISAGDTVRFSYTNPGDEVVLTFSPKPPSDIKLDHDSTLKSYIFTQTGTYTYHKKDDGGPTGTIIVQ